MPTRANQTTVTLNYFIKEALEVEIGRLFGVTKFETWDEFILYIVEELKELDPEDVK